MPKHTLFDVIYEDETILLLSKNYGIPVIPERGPSKTLSLIEILNERSKNTILPVHRIDRDTSGLILFAKTADSHRWLNDRFMKGEVEKKYLAICQGKLIQPDWETIEAPIFKKPNSSKVAIQPNGKNAITLYRTIESFKDATLLEVSLKTGRTHQIRIHLSHMGFPLFVDPVYGTRSEFFLSEMLKRKYKLKKNEVEKALISRQTLHAWKLGFNHPETEELLTFEAPIPKDLKAFLNQLRKRG